MRSMVEGPFNRCYPTNRSAASLPPATNIP